MHRAADRRRTPRGWGLVSDPALYRRSLDVNVNVWWGAVLLGLLAFLAATRRGRG